MNNKIEHLLVAQKKTSEVFHNHSMSEPFGEWGGARDCRVVGGFGR